MAGILVYARHAYRIWQVVLFYETFMLVVQIMLLNLLIAIMSDCYSRVHHVAQLVAYLKRAEIILEQEQSLVRSLGRTAGWNPPLAAGAGSQDSDGGCSSGKFSSMCKSSAKFSA